MQLQTRSDDIYLPTLRDVAHPLFRYRRAVVTMFVAVATAVAVAAALAERTYTADMKILVKRERLDPIVTSDQQVPSGVLEVRESELFAEVELLTSRDLLEQVAVSSGLLAGADPGAPGYAERLDRAVSALHGRLTVTQIRKTTMISVAYRSGDPQLAARVLEQVAAHYLAKHLSVHRPAGARQFFAEQAARSEDALRAAEARLAAFTAREHVVSPPSETESTLQKLSEFEATLQENAAAIADATRRMSAVEAELAQTPARQVTQVSDGGNVDAI